MIISLFKKLIGKNSNYKAEKARIEEIMANAKDQSTEWDDSRMGEEPIVREKILNRLLDSIAHEQPIRKTNTITKWAVAASLFFALGFGWYYFQHNGLWNQTTAIVLKTGRNEIRKVTLSDGSVVWLNGSTSISYPDQFDDHKRVVELLEGEAFFDIKHDEKKPFQVKAGKTLTNVLGTAFNINSYSWRETINVTVARGKVAVNNNILLPNDQLAYAKATGKSETKQLHSDEITSWMQGKLTFNDESLKAIATLLENKYNVEIRFGDKHMSESRFTGRFEPADDLYDILDALTMTRGLTYEAKGAVILINH
jgi:transmembrane sensor